MLLIGGLSDPGASYIVFWKASKESNPAARYQSLCASTPLQLQGFFVKTLVNVFALSDAGLSPRELEVLETLVVSWPFWEYFGLIWLRARIFALNP